ncbi:MAG: hypothetical protein EOP05_18970 [Proteobacteria bacterium]|nr:MAG: hypothetical protein EOP05_18970 [Pseudomonadota bacterium]
MAESLVKEMTAKWEPKKYKDTYQDDLLKRIEQKIKGGDTEAPPESEDIEATDTNVIDLMPLLAQSLKSKGGKKTAAKTRRKVAPKRKVTKKAK